MEKVPFELVLPDKKRILYAVTRRFDPKSLYLHASLLPATLLKLFE
jgi:hypothetical protein